MEKVQYGNFAIEPRRRNNKWVRYLYDLLDQPAPRGRIECKDTYTAHVAYSALAQAIIRNNIPVSVLLRGVVVYLVKKDVQ